MNITLTNSIIKSRLDKIMEPVLFSSPEAKEDEACRRIDIQTAYYLYNGLGNGKTLKASPVYFIITGTEGTLTDRIESVLDIFSSKVSEYLVGKSGDAYIRQYPEITYDAVDNIVHLKARFCVGFDADQPDNQD